jgi:probable LLM family oxidoreductase
MELGIYTFGDLAPGTPGAGSPELAGRRLRELVAEVELADRIGLDVFAIGEHHRPDFVVSVPSIVLAAAAARTERIRLSSAVTVLSSDDPVRVFQQFATLDLLSGGRAEIMAGRGSFVESFPLFGYDLDDYDRLFDEKLRLLVRLQEGEHVTWDGPLRPPIDGRGVYPRPLQDPLPVWVAVGGNPDSAVRAGGLGLPMALAIIGGMPERFAPFAELHREAARRAGHERPRLAINSHGYVAGSLREAIDVSFPHVAAGMNAIGRERGWAPMTRGGYEASADIRGANMLGSPGQVAEKILFQHGIFGHDRFLLQISLGGMPHEAVMRAIELFGTEVAPLVREVLGAGAP